MQEGRIIEYIDQSKVVCTFCLQDKGNRLHLLTASNREVNLSLKRALLISDTVLDPARPREEILEMLREADGRRERLKVRVNVQELWELVRDAGEHFDHDYLAHLVFEEEVTPDHISALVRALFEERLHFKMKEGRFLPNTEERIEQIQRQRKEEALREQWLNQGSAWLRDVLQGGRMEAPPCKDDIIHLLVQMALYENEFTDFKYARELLSRAGIADIRKTRALLLKLGVWEEDQNLDLLRFGIGEPFSESLLAESARLATFERPHEGREDLRDLATFTIDGPSTRDFDDALSLHMKDDGLELGIHIADVAAVITPDSELDREAAGRGASLYLPRGQIPMIPPELSQHTLSLKQDLDRPAVSLFARFDPGGNLLDYRFLLSIIRVRHRLTYDQVNERLESDQRFKEMHALSQKLRHHRLALGALSLSLPELLIRFNPDATLSVDQVDQNSPSRMIVAECMILYNFLAACFCRDQNIPTLFRTQAEPSERLIQGENGYLFYVFRQRRKLSPLQIETEPKPHCGIGLDVYTQTTSPIRRYLDLVVQRQIQSRLLGIPPVCDEEALEEIRLNVGPVLKNLELIKRRRLRYWILKFLSQNRGKPLRAVVLDELMNRYRLVLADSFLVAEIRRENGMQLRPGEEVTVAVRKADHWEDRLDLTLVAENRG